MWYHAQATVQQEHFTSALAHRRLDTLIAATPPPTRPETVLIGCPVQEQHTFTPLLLTLLLRRRGLKVVYLGANVPKDRFRETLFTVKPNLVILSAQLLQTANGVRETAEQLNASGARVAYGGRIFNLSPNLCIRIPAHFLGESLPEAIQTIETLLASETPLEDVEPVSEQATELSRSFIRSQPMINVYMISETIKAGIPPEFSTIAIHQLGKDINSALSFGYIEALEKEIEWIRGLLVGHNQNAKSLSSFLTAYATAIDLAMGKEGLPISTWLKAQIH